MVGSENDPGAIRPSNFQGLHAVGSKFMAAAGHNRRALGNIDLNIIGAPPYQCAANNRALCENFSARLADKQQFKPEETKISVPISVESKDVHITDVEEDNYADESSDFGAPMFVQHTEAMLKEIDQMEEIEMEDMDEELVLDIDSCDRKNPLAAVEYVDDMYKFYRKKESPSCIPPNYMEDQHDINEKMRGILIDWLIEVHCKFELMEETLYLTVNLIDRFLAVRRVVRKKLQLVGITAMLLACKYEEVSVPMVDDLILISDKAYNRKEVLDMEKLMISTLQFNLSAPTPYMFMRRFLKAAQSNKQLELLSFFIVELCLVEFEMTKYPPSLLAASAIYTAQCTLSRAKPWNKTCELHTGYSEEQLLECSKLMVGFHQKAGTGKLTGVYRKYSVSKFGYAAKTEPANFLLKTGVLF